jgi:hypothetical protein
MTKPIDHLLRETLERRLAGTPLTPCLDAETAAAFVDRALTGDERSTAEAHAADCARCQMLLSALERTAPPAAARAWWRRPAVAWLAPLTAAAAAVIVLLNVPRPTNLEPVLQTAREETRSVESTAPPTAAGDTAAARRSQAAPDPANVRRPSSALAATQERDRTASGNASVPGTPPAAVAETFVAVAPPASNAARAAPAPAEAPLPSTSLPQTETLQRSTSITSDSSRAAAAPQAPQASRAETVTLGAEVTGRAARRLGDGSEMVIVSPDAISRWRIAGAVVQHSSDGGATWQTQSAGLNVALASGSSPSRSVCWLVGAAGVVLVSIDEGRSWQRLAFPETIDLTAVRATDDRTASVVAADGRTFTTSDRGRSWSR